MSFLNGFLDNVVSGALNPKGNLADYQHGARLYVDDSHRLSPKVKFLYHVSFNINSQAASIIPQLTQKHNNELNMLVKNVQLPSYNVQTDVKHQYNRKRVVQKRIDYSPITVQFHDDAFGVTTAMWEAYYRYYFRDGNYASVQPDGSPDPTKKQFRSATQFNRGNAFSERQYRYGFDNDSLEPFFNSIVIYQMSRKKYTAMTLVNPLISQWQHDTMDNSVSDPVTNSMSLEYETVHYSRGAIGKGGPKGFGEEHYDKTASPNSLMGGGASSLLGVGGVLAGGFGVLDDISGGTVGFGTVLKAANAAKNMGNLSKAGIGGELLGQGLATLGQTTGVPVSGVANTAFPSGGSGGNAGTVALAALLVGGANALKNAGSSGASTSGSTTTNNNSTSGPNGGGEFAEE
tara:strand:+ start:57303 stop:58511 length:1209 start_codon:yes stop_codon:yes gene_type:complete